MPPIICIVGKSGSGKTTLIEKLVPVLKRRGHRIGTVKHALHGFEIDREGKDSWRHQHSGADVVVLASPGKLAMVKTIHDDTLDGLVPYFSNMDLVIVEGYKHSSTSKIEVFRSEAHSAPLKMENGQRIAFVSDDEIDCREPRFGLEDIEPLADFIEMNCL